MINLRLKNIKHIRKKDFHLNGHEFDGKKSSGIFRGRRVTQVGFGDAVRVWKKLYFELPRHFKIAILAAKFAVNL